jgi:ABC-2 type transport system permease protein
MIGELFRLKVRVLVNGLRIPGTVVAGAVMVVIGGVGLIALGAAATGLSALDELTVRRIVAVAGAALALGAFLVPVMVVRRDLVDPRAFLGYGFPLRTIGTALVLLGLVGPAVVLVPLALVPVAVWSGDGATVVVTVAPLIVLEGLLAVRLGVVAGTALRLYPAASFFVRAGGVLVLSLLVLVIGAHLAPVLAAMLPSSMWPLTLPVVLALAPWRDPRIADTLGATPLGALWRAPMEAEFGDPTAALGDVGLALLLLLALGVAWALTVRYVLRASQRQPRAKAARVPGWFRRLPSSPWGAIAARSLIYWVRDPRYRVVLAVLPIVAVVVGGILSVAGVPAGTTALVPLPTVLFLLSWVSLHNDVALDSSALWSQLAAQARGVQDRAARALPVLVLGVVLLAAGTPLTAWGYGSPLIAPAVFGVGAALLFGGIGVSSLISARFPYPATRPGDAAFQQPQVPGSGGGLAQAGAMLFTLLVAAPALAASALWLLGVPGLWNWAALGVGVVAGLGMFLVGLRAGGAIYDRRAPELLAFTMRN